MWIWFLIAYVLFNIFVIRVNYKINNRTVWHKWLFYKIFWPVLIYKIWYGGKI